MLPVAGADDLSADDFGAEAGDDGHGEDAVAANLLDAARGWRAAHDRRALRRLLLDLLRHLDEEGSG